VIETIRFYYDLVCPYSYLEARAVETAEDEGLLKVEWLPFELRPAPRPLLAVRGEHLRVDWTEHVYNRALALGIEIHLPRYQPRSSLPLAVCLWADSVGRLRELRQSFYEAFFCEGEDIVTEEEIARIAARAGLEPAAAVEAAYSPERLEELKAIRRAAEELGVRGVPTLVTQDGRTHWGSGGVRRLLENQPLIPRPL
jgi:predicted DsbA family dithiol-disulfide isomerase